MRRGEVWTVAGGPDYAGKPRPAVILQDQRFEMIESVTIIPFTADLADAALFRLRFQPDTSNGLRAPSDLMVDKITTVPLTKMGHRIGELGVEDVRRINRAIVVFLGLAGPTAT